MSNWNDYSGLLVLRGTNSGSPDWVWRHLMSGVPEHLALGQVRNSVNLGFDITPDTPLSEVLATTIKSFAWSPYSYIVWSSKPVHVVIPQRNATVTAWFTEGEEVANQAIQRLLRLNADQWPAESGNYANKVATRVLSRLGSTPKSATMLYAGPAPTILLSSYLQRVYVWVFYIEGSYTLLWSTNENLVKYMLASMNKQERNKLVALPVDLDPNMVLALNPVHMINKLHTFLKNFGPSNTKYVCALQYISNRIVRTAIPLEVNNEGNGQNSSADH